MTGWRSPFAFHFVQTEANHHWRYLYSINLHVLLSHYKMATTMLSQGTASSLAPRACEILQCHKGCRLQDYKVDVCLLQRKKNKKQKKQGFEDVGAGLKGQAVRWRTTPVMFVWDKMFVRRFRKRITIKFPATETRWLWSSILSSRKWPKHSQSCNRTGSFHYHITQHLSTTGTSAQWPQSTFSSDL